MQGTWAKNEKSQIVYWKNLQIEWILKDKLLFPKCLYCEVDNENNLRSGILC